MDGLVLDVSKHLDIALKVFNLVENASNQNLKCSFSSFAHLIRWNWLRESSLSELELSITDKNQYNEIKFNIKRTIQDKLENILSPSWSFDCPVCDEPDSFICEMDKVKLNNKIVSLKRGACANCDLVLKQELPILVNVLCEKQLIEINEEILREYGIH
jgi:transcription elongation factor Elf1